MLAIVVAGLMATPPQAAANLVQNNSFEDDGVNLAGLVCPMSNWSGCIGINAGETTFFASTIAALAAPLFPTYLAIGTPGRLGYVSQDIPTSGGQRYRFTFAFTSDGDPANRFQALWGGSVLMDVTGAPFNPGWISNSGGCPYISDPQYEACIQSGGGGPAFFSFDVTALAPITTISFGGEGNASGTSFVGIDDVFVTPVAEPPAWLLLCIAMAGTFLVRRRGDLVHVPERSTIRRAGRLLMSGRVSPRLRRLSRGSGEQLRPGRGRLACSSWGCVGIVQRSGRAVDEIIASA
jgi:hypothetical protein